MPFLTVPCPSTLHARSLPAKLLSVQHVDASVSLSPQRSKLKEPKQWRCFWGKKTNPTDLSSPSQSRSLLGGQIFHFRTHPNFRAVLSRLRSPLTSSSREATAPELVVSFASAVIANFTAMVVTGASCRGISDEIILSHWPEIRLLLGMLPLTMPGFGRNEVVTMAIIAYL